MSTELERAYGYCQKITRSRAKNFYYAFMTLPANKRRAVYAAYAFCRLCDDIADEDHSSKEKRLLLSRTRDMLHQSRNGTVADPVFRALGDTATVYGIPAQYFQDIIDGVEMDLVHTRFQSFDELRTYCYRVASTVGLISIEVFGYKDPRAKEYAIDLGIAMQLTNIMRDIKEDAQRGRIYIPMEEMARFGYSERELEEEVLNEAFRNLMRYQVARARCCFARGRRLIPLLSPRARACPAVLIAIYSDILDRIEACDFNVFRQRIGLSTKHKLILMARLWATSLIPGTLPQRR